MEGRVDSSSLEVILSYERPSMSEQTFITRYIPLLIADNIRPFNMAWLNEVTQGRMSLAVDLVDETGTIVDTVPPLRGTVARIENPRITELLQKAQAQRNVVPALGERMLADILESTMKFNDTMPEDLAKDWRRIVTKYANVRFEDNDNESTTSSETGGIGIIEDDVEW